MIIKNEKEYKKFENRMEVLIQHGTELGDMDLLSEKEKEEFMMLSEALDEYGSAYHPLPGQMSTLLTDAILTQVKEKGLKQKEAAQMIGISPTFFSDLLHGRRTLSFEVARTIHKVLGIPAEVVLA
ncbi:MAG: helix-turn-helix domain-containing protein [Prevotella sp.]|nr:helix-turn-helix domain-containing protein [Prevotella sp.]